MFELTINNKVYQFNFGMGFMREANKRVKIPVDGLPGVEKNIGLQYMIASIIDNDVEALVDALDVANMAFKPRVSRNELDAYVDETDIDELFKTVLDFLQNANATKKIYQNLMAAVEEAQKK